MRRGSNLVAPLTGALVIGCVLAVFAGVGATSSPAEEGAELFRNHCAACHGTQGKGDGPVAEDLRTKPLDLTKIAARRNGEFNDNQIVEFIDGRRWVRAHGPREMPVWGLVFGKGMPGTTRHESEALGSILALVDYLKSIQDPPLEPKN
jgi:mono/diheme cytochrome c family protein